MCKLWIWNFQGVGGTKWKNLKKPSVGGGGGGVWIFSGATHYVSLCDFQKNTKFIQ